MTAQFGVNVDFLSPCSMQLSIRVLVLSCPLNETELPPGSIIMALISWTPCDLLRGNAMSPVTWNWSECFMPIRSMLRVSVLQNFPPYPHPPTLAFESDRVGFFCIFICTCWCCAALLLCLILETTSLCGHYHRFGYQSHNWMCPQII